MTRRAWVRLDNASNIFLAARSDADPKVFRISAEMDHDVDPQLLQEALDATYDRYRLYHAVLRSGVFWYYLQDSDLRPLVTAEELAHLRAHLSGRSAPPAVPSDAPSPADHPRVVPRAVRRHRCAVVHLRPGDCLHPAAACPDRSVRSRTPARPSTRSPIAVGLTPVPSPTTMRPSRHMD